MPSIRRALISGTILGTAIILAASGVLLYTFVRADLLDQFDGALNDKANLLRAAVEDKGGRAEIDFDQFDMHEFEGREGPGYLQLKLADGREIYRSPSLGEKNLQGIASAADPPRAQWISLPGGRTGRAVGITFNARGEEEEEGAFEENNDEKDGGRVESGHAGDGESEADHATERFPQKGEPPLFVRLVLARDISPVAAALFRLKTLLVLVGILTILVSSGVLWLIIRRNLEPLERLADTIDRIGEKDLSATIAVKRAPRELIPVVERLNSLLGRLEAAFERERAFSAEVAHELRTPLAGLRSILEVMKAKPRSPEEYAEALGDSLGIVLQMGSMVEKLLAAARMEANLVIARPEDLSLGALIRDVFEPFEDQARSRGLKVRWSLDEEDRVLADPSLLAMVCRNILENAVHYADKGGYVAVETETREKEIVLSVRNSGSDLPREEADSVLERFFRGDRARTEAASRCGLGLFLVKKTVELLHGSVAVRSEKGGDFAVILRIPRKVPAGPDPSGPRLRSGSAA